MDYQDETQDGFTVQVTGKQIEASVSTAIRSFLEAHFKSPTSSSFSAGAGYKLLEQRVNEWSQTFDFKPVIERAAAPIVNAAIQETIKKAIQNRAGQLLATMIASGELDTYIAFVIEQRIEAMGLATKAADKAAYLDSNGSGIRSKRGL